MSDTIAEIGSTNVYSINGVDAIPGTVTAGTPAWWMQHNSIVLSGLVVTVGALTPGTAAGDLVQLDGSGLLPAVDGSQLLNLPAPDLGGSITLANSNTFTITCDPSYFVSFTQASGYYTFDNPVDAPSFTASSFNFQDNKYLYVDSFGNLCFYDGSTSHTIAFT